MLRVLKLYFFLPAWLINVFTFKTDYNIERFPEKIFSLVIIRLMKKQTSEVPKTDWYIITCLSPSIEKSVFVVNLRAKRSSRSAVIFFEKFASSLAGRVTRIFEKGAPAKPQTISVENRTNTSAATDSSNPQWRFC